jgi:hypothetical protein
MENHLKWVTSTSSQSLFCVKNLLSALRSRRTRAYPSRQLFPSKVRQLSKRRVVCVLLISFLLSSLGCAGSPKGYQAKFPDKAATNAVLLPWETSSNDGDLADVPTVVSANTEIMDGSDKAIPFKNGLADTILERMESNPTVTRGPPEIKANGQKTVATTSPTTRERSIPVTF